MIVHYRVMMHLGTLESILTLLPRFQTFASFVSSIKEAKV